MTIKFDFLRIRRFCFLQPNRGVSGMVIECSHRTPFLSCASEASWIHFWQPTASRNYANSGKFNFRQKFVYRSHACRRTFPPASSSPTWMTYMLVTSRNADTEDIWNFHSQVGFWVFGLFELQLKVPENYCCFNCVFCTLLLVTDDKAGFLDGDSSRKVGRDSQTMLITKGINMWNTIVVWTKRDLVHQVLP